jgi:hypothetical protein
MSTRKLTEAERQALAKRRWDFVAGREPAWSLKKREQQEAQRQYELEQKGDYRHLAGIELGKRRWHIVNNDAAEKEWEAVILPSIHVFVTNEHIRFLQLLIKTGLVEPSRQLLLDLVASDAPLDSGTRRQIVGELERFYRSERPDSPKAKKHHELLTAHQLQTYFECYAGMTPGKAEQEAAEAMGLDGLDDVSALRKRRERYRKRKLPR